MISCDDVAKWLSVRTHNTVVVSSIPPCITIKTPLARKATGNPLLKPTSLVKLSSLPLVSATLEIEYATQYSSVFKCCILHRVFPSNVL